MFQGIQAVALPMVQEFGYTKEIEDRVLAPLPVSLVALEKVVVRRDPGPAGGVHRVPDRRRRACARRSTSTCRCTGRCCSRWCRSPAWPARRWGSRSARIFDPRTVPLLFGIIILPLTFLGGTYYPWTTLSPVTVCGVHWLQILVLVNPLVYINEGFRAALTTVRPHVAVGGLPGADRVHRVLPVAGHDQLPAARDQLGRRPGAARSLLSSSRPAGWRSG